MTAILLALGAAVGWGLADFIAGHTSRLATTAAVLFGSQVVGVAVAGAAIGLTSPQRPTGALVGFAALSGTALAVGLGSLYEGMRVGAIGLVASISATAAAVPVVYSIARGERPTPLQGLGLALAFFGVILAATARGGGRGTYVAAGVAFALLSALAGGLNNIFLKSASPDGVLWTLLVQRTTVTILACALLVAVRPAVAMPRRVLPLVVAVGVIDVVATGSFALSTTRGLLSLVSVTGALYPAVTVLLARVVLAERLSGLQKTGVVSALAGVAVLVGAQGG